MKKYAVNKIVFVLVFIALGFLAMQVPFSQIIGAKDLKFSLFDFYGPIAGGFVGSVWGLLLVAVMQGGNWAYHGFQMDIGTMIRFLPMLIAVLYFARKNALILIVPGLAMVAFWAHPEGRAAWYYALYWLIPFVAYFFRDRYTFFRALGSTFTAHSVGSVLFLWFFNLKSEVWLGLIPIVWQERVLMAAGISVAYIAINFAMSLLVYKAHIKLPFVRLNPRYSAGAKR